jgi:hypothetical protein
VGDKEKISQQIMSGRIPFAPERFLGPPSVEDGKHQKSKGVSSNSNDKTEGAVKGGGAAVWYPPDES